MLRPAIILCIGAWFLIAARAQSAGDMLENGAEHAAQEEHLVSIQTGLPAPAHTFVVHSEALDEPRRIYVQTPEGYEIDEAAYPVLFAMDAEWLFHLASAHARYYAYDEVTDVTMPRMIVVGVENTDRDRDYTPTDSPGREIDAPTAGEADAFLNFLEFELIPLIESRYRVAPHRAVVGWSYSGLFSAYAAIARPALFNHHLCISPAIWWDDDLVFRRLADVAFEQPKKMTFTLGGNEAGGWVYQSTRRLLDELANTPHDNLSVTDFEIADVGHTWGVARAMDLGLQSLYSDYVAPADIIARGREAVGAYYDDLSRQWGYDVKPPGKVLAALAAQLFGAGDADGAFGVMAEAIANDPNDSSAYFLLGRLHAALGETGQARSRYNQAIEAELRKTVPNGVNLRGFRRAVASADAPSD